MQLTDKPSQEFERLMTIKKASAALGIEYRQLIRGVEAGQIPFYRVGTSRRLVRLSEVLASMRQLTSNRKENYND